MLLDVPSVEVVDFLTTGFLVAGERASFFGAVDELVEEVAGGVIDEVLEVEEGAGVLLLCAVCRITTAASKIKNAITPATIRFELDRAIGDCLGAGVSAAAFAAAFEEATTGSEVTSSDLEVVTGRIAGEGTAGTASDAAASISEMLLLCCCSCAVEVLEEEVTFLLIFLTSVEGAVFFSTLLVAIFFVATFFTKAFFVAGAFLAALAFLATAFFTVDLDVTGLGAAALFFATLFFAATFFATAFLATFFAAVFFATATVLTP